MFIYFSVKWLHFCMDLLYTQPSPFLAIYIYPNSCILWYNLIPAVRINYFISFSLNLFLISAGAAAIYLLLAFGTLLCFVFIFYVSNHRSFFYILALSAFGILLYFLLELLLPTYLQSFRYLLMLCLHFLCT